MNSEIRELDHRVGMLLAALCGVTVGIVGYVVIHPVALVGYDFEAFWCGAQALLQHANPYANEPLHTCEALTSPAFFLRYPQATIPVPLPAYAIALFVPFALMPFAFALVLWWLIQVACAVIIAGAIFKISGMPPITALAASTLAVLGPAILQGALSPVPIALTVCAALALQRRRWNLATVLLGCAMIEPHVVLPACAVVFLLVRQMRGRLLVAGVVAATVMLAVIGPQVAVSYFTTVLPAHAASEVNNLGQYSLTALLYHLGVGPAAALRVGAVQYGILATCGFFAARALSKKYRDLSWLILLPAAFAVVGGAFIHLDEVAMAVPLACLIAMRRPGPVPLAVVVMLALPVEAIVAWIPLAVPAALICIWFMDRPECILKRYSSNGVLPAIVAVVLLLGASALHAIDAAHAQQGVHQTTYFSMPGHNASASVTWSAYNALARMSALWWPEKAWTFLPLVTLLALCAAEVFARDRSRMQRTSSALPWPHVHR